MSGWRLLRCLPSIGVEIDLTDSFTVVRNNPNFDVI